MPQDHKLHRSNTVYVLNEPLQSGKAHNKWWKRSRVGIFLGFSPNHATSVPLVLNTTTACVSPQFHVVFDPEFKSVERDANFKSIWQFRAKLQQTLDKLTINDVDPTSVEDSTNLPPKDERVLDAFKTQWTKVSPASNAHQTQEHNVDQELVTDATQDQEGSNGNPEDQQESPPQRVEGATQDSEGADHIDDPSSDNNTVSQDQEQRSPTTTTRSGRASYRPARFASIAAFISKFSPEPDSPNIELLQPAEAYHDDFDPFALFSVTALASKSQDPDTLTYQEAMRADDRDKFIEAMKKEIGDHIRRKHWVVIRREEVSKKNRQLIPLVWSMKRKKDPTGEIIKWKARLCVGGHRQVKGVDYWSTYSPVVAWSTVRLVLIFAIINNWTIQSIDFVQAFPQADVQTETFLHPPRVPKGFKIPDLPTAKDFSTKCYKLLKNLYGACDASKIWFDYARDGLLRRDWKQSEVDSCLFTKDNMLFILWVDDAVLLSPDKSAIDREIKSLFNKLPVSTIIRKSATKKP